MNDKQDVVVRVDKETRQRAKIEAAKKGVTLKEYLAELVKQDAGKDKKPATTN